jgi:hypothetical protein
MTLGEIDAAHVEHCVRFRTQRIDLSSSRAVAIEQDPDVLRVPRDVVFEAGEAETG